MEYVFLECPTCSKQVPHYEKDIRKKDNRICPKCGYSFLVQDSRNREREARNPRSKVSRH